MKIVVMGGKGLIGAKVVRSLQGLGHEVGVASRNSGVDLMTGAGLTEILVGAQVVVDLTNASVYDDAGVMAFFETAARNLLPAEVVAGVGHHVVLSIVGADGMPDSGYMRAKVVQEEAVKRSGVPYTIVRATQFFEYIGVIAGAYTAGDTVRLSNVLMQPVAAEDVADAVVDAVLAAPRNGTVELGGPERIRMDELVRRLLAAGADARAVVTDVDAGYFGAKVSDRSLVPAGAALVGTTEFQRWLERTTPRSPLL